MNAIRPLVLALTVAGALMVPSQKANANLIYAALGSGVCKASDGLNTNLQYNLYYVRNKSAVTQYVTCNAGFLRERVRGLLPNAGYTLTMIIGSTSATPQNVTCTASVGTGGGVSVQSTKTVTVSSTQAARLEYTTAELRALSDVASLSVYCGMKPGTLIGLFIAGQPEINTLVP